MIVNIKDTVVHAFRNRMEFIDFISEKKAILVAINAEKILNDDLRLKKIINENIGYPDGIGAVMALRQKGYEAVRIPGAEFWLEVIEKSYHSKTFYFIGSSQEIIQKTVDKLDKQFPGIDIVGYRNGYIDQDGKEELKELLLKSKPDIIFVAQGSPRQEYLMDDLIRVHPALYMGLGGSFDVYTEVKTRAPEIFIRYNLEWLYRLLKEPTRLGRQIKLIKFLYLFIMKIL